MNQNKIYFRPNEFRSNVENLYQHGLERGMYCGFETLNEHYTLKIPATTYIYSAPFSGKTEFWFDILVNLSELYGYKHVIYSPESGDKENIVAELISKAARKPFYRQYKDYLSESDLYRYMDWVDEHFFIIDPQEKGITIEDFYTTCDLIERDYKIKINTTLCDPFNELEHDLKADDGRQDLYIAKRLSFVRRNAKLYSRHNVIITHCTDQQQVKTTDIEGKEIWYYPIPQPRQIAGGQEWYRKGMMIICVWRPPLNVIDKLTGRPYEENETHIIIQKFKPKGTGKRGTVKLFYDAHKNRFYEKSNGSDRYAGSKPIPTEIVRNSAFDF